MLDRELIGDLYLQGKSQYEIADIVGCTQPTVSKILGKINLRKDKDVCKYGHPLTEDNLVQASLRLGMRRCLICFREYQNRRRREQRHDRGLQGNKYKTHCPKGHLLSGSNLRKNRKHRECATCHTNQEQLRRMKEEGGECIDREEVRKRDNDICSICQELILDDEWHLDHIIPISRGGTHTYDNVGMSHVKCNRLKSDIMPEEFELLKSLGILG